MISYLQSRAAVTGCMLVLALGMSVARANAPDTIFWNAWDGHDWIGKDIGDGRTILEVNQGYDITHCDPGNWIMYKDINLYNGYNQFDVWVARSGNTSSWVELRVDAIDGLLLAKLIPTDTGGWGIWCSPTNCPYLRLQSVDVLATASGVRDVWIVFAGSNHGVGNFTKFGMRNPVASGPGNLQFSSATYSVSEAAGSATISVSRSGGSLGAVGVSYATSNGTAQTGTHYTAASGTLSWATGNTDNKTFIVPITANPYLDAGKTVNLTLSSPTGGATLGAHSTATLTIAPTKISISPAVCFAATGGTVQFSATVLGENGLPMSTQPSFTWSVSGSQSISTSGLFTAGSSVGGPYTVTAQATVGGAQRSVTAQVRVVTAPDVTLKVNCGDNAHDVTGWQRDDSYVTGGADYNNPATVSVSGIANAAPAAVYKSVRHQSPHTYAFSELPDGIYRVRLHLADPFSTSVRMMNYVLQGDTLIRDLSIVAEAGGANIAMVKDMWATASGGAGLTLHCFGASNSDVFESGIEIDGVASNPSSIRSAGLGKNRDDFNIVSASSGRIAVQIHSAGEFTARVIAPNGATLKKLSGHGPALADLSFPAASGVVLLEVYVKKERIVKPFFIK